MKNMRSSHRVDDEADIRAHLPAQSHLSINAHS